MVKIPGKFVLFGAIAAAAVVIPGVLGPMGLQDAYAARGDQSNDATNTAENALVQANVQANVNAKDVVDVNNNDVAVCVIARDCTNR